MSKSDEPCTTLDHLMNVFFLFPYLCTRVWAGLPQHVCRGQSTMCGSWFSPSPVSFLGIKLQSPGLVVNDFIHWAISFVLFFFSFVRILISFHCVLFYFWILISYYGLLICTKPSQWEINVIGDHSLGMLYSQDEILNPYTLKSESFGMLCIFKKK